MTSYEPCKLHEITRCSICTGLDKRLAKEAEQESMNWRPPTTFTMLSRWPGKCPACGDDYPAGTPISNSGNGWTCCK